MMPSKISRREMLARTLGGAGLLAGGGLPAILTTKQALAATQLPDRSEDAPSSPVSI